MMLSIAEKIACLKESELFSDLAVDDLEGIAIVAQELHLADDQTIFHNGEKGDAVYFVVRGQVRGHKSGVEIVRLGENECVGEMGVIDAGPRSLSVSTIGNVVLLKVDHDDFYRASQGNVKLLRNVLKIVLRKLREDTDRRIEAARERERIMHDMKRARELQMGMLPTQDLRVTSAGGVRLEASGNCCPAEMVGGDYYDYFPLPGDRVGLVVGDVMGHGFHTGLMVSMAKSCLHTQIRTDWRPPSVMSAMNDMVYAFVQSDLYSDIIFPPFMSFCYIIVDLRGQTISFSNAGHCYPYHYHADTKRLTMLESGPCLLGVLGSQNYEDEVSQLEWSEGDIFVLYTDGIVEAQNEKDEDFGEERLQQLTLENAHLAPAELKETILRELDSFCQGVIQADDVSLVIVKMGDRRISYVR